MNNSNAPYYTAKADENGYFKIGSRSLPATAYSLRYFSPTGMRMDLKTSDFIRNNRNYIAKNHIELYSYHNSQGEKEKANSSQLAKLTGTVGRTNGKEKGSLSGQNDQANQPTSTSSLSPTKNRTIVLLMLVIMMILLVAVIAFLVVYLLRKKQSSINNDDL